MNKQELAKPTLEKIKKLLDKPIKVTKIASEELSMIDSTTINITFEKTELVMILMEQHERG